MRVAPVQNKPQRHSDITANHLPVMRNSIASERVVREVDRLLKKVGRAVALQCILQKVSACTEITVDEGDTLIVDTIGLNTRTFIDSFLTPYTDKLHVVERFRMVDGGKALEVQVHVEDPGAFTIPWNATQRYRRVDEEGKANDERQMGGPMEEMACAENNRGIGPIPTAPASDF